MTRRFSITLRLTLLFGATSVIVLLALGYLITETVEHHFEGQDFEILVGKIELAQHALSTVTSRAELDALPLHLSNALVGHYGLSMTVVGAHGQTVFATPNAVFPPALLRATGSMPRMSTDIVVWEQDDHAYRSLTAVIPIAWAAESPVTVAVATDISHHMELLRAFNATLWWVMGFTALLSAVLGWVATRFGLMPLRDIARISREASIDRLDARIQLDSIPIELKETATAFNDMLARLEDSFRRLTDFASDIAHELRTPISNLMTQTHVTLAQARTIEDYREVLFSNAEEFDRLARMVSDMLFLAKADHGLIMPQCEAVDLARELAELIEFYGIAAHERDVILQLEGTGIVMGDRPMLRRAIGNLLSNAIRHSHPAGSVRVAVITTSDGNISVSVENTGAEIAPEQLPRIFDRFYRADPSRHGSSEGAGLGLAITQSIVHAHHGKIQAMSANGITRFTITFSSGVN